MECEIVENEIRFVGSQESNMFLWTMLTDDKFIGAFGVVVLGLLGSL
jgi:hypothetical protein